MQFLGTTKKADAQFVQVGNNLEVRLNGSSDKIVVQNWYLGTQYHVEEFRFSDGTIGDTQIQGVASAKTSFRSPTSGIASVDSHATSSGFMMAALTHNLVNAMAAFQAPGGSIQSAPMNRSAHNHMFASGVTSPALL